MMISYEWSYPEKVTIETADGVTDFITHIRWQAKATDENGKSETSSGMVAIPFNKDDGFTPADQLSDETIAEWVATRLDAEEVEAALAACIAAQYSAPEPVAPPPPASQYARLHVGGRPDLSQVK